MLALLLACLLLIILPILAIQLTHITSSSPPSARTTRGFEAPSPSPPTTTKQDIKYQRKPWDPPFPTCSPSTQIPHQAPHQEEQEEEQQDHTPHQIKHTALSALKVLLLVLASLVFVFAFAVLVAHCLAVFIVYKTEARLGEARRGVVSGGDMRMCLCARG